MNNESIIDMIINTIEKSYIQLTMIMQDITIKGVKIPRVYFKVHVPFASVWMHTDIQT